MRMMGTDTNIQELRERVRTVVNSTAGHVSFMMEDEGGNQYQIEADTHKKAASLIKIPILMAAFKQVEAGRLKLTDRHLVEAESRVGGAGVISQLDAETIFTLLDLLTLMIIVSDNAATNKVIDMLGMDDVNEFCTKHGLSKTKLERKMMDFKAAGQGLENRTCARDIVKCLKLLLENRNGVFTEENRLQMLKIFDGQQLLDKLPFLMDLDSVRIANKTGELPGVEHDCGIVALGEKKVLVAVLIDDLTDNAVGKKAIQEIGKIVEKYMQGPKSE